MTARASAVIVGGGPAGAATAIALARAGGSAVLVRVARDDARQAGEVLRPEAKLALGRLGVWERFMALAPEPCHAIDSAWGGADVESTDFLFNAYGPAWHVERRRLDAMLTDAAESLGVTVVRGGRVGRLSRERDTWHLEIAHDGRTRHVEAPVLVDATGRSASFARALGVGRRVIDRLIALIAVLAPAPHREPASTVLLVEATEHGWWYSVPRPDGSMVAAFMTDPDTLGREGKPGDVWCAALSRTRHTRARVDGLQPVGRISAHPAGSARLDVVAGHGWVAVGDAACTYDPLSGVGIVKALESGASAAAAVGDPDALVAYGTEASARYERYLAQRRGYYAIERRWPHAPFWQRRHAGGVQVAVAGDADR